MPTNYPAKQMLGTAQTVINTATNLAASNFTGAPTTYDVTGDAATPNARFALAVAVFPSWASAPAAGTVVDLYGVPQNVDSTSDDTDAPSGSTVGGARWLGAFVLANSASLQRRTIVIDLLGFLYVDFYLRNGSAVQMTNNGGTNCSLKVTPIAEGITV